MKILAGLDRLDHLVWLMQRVWVIFGIDDTGKAEMPSCRRRVDLTAASMRAPLGLCGWLPFSMYSVRK